MTRAMTRPLYTKERVLGDRILEAVLNKNAKELAELMTTKAGNKQLNQMLKLGENSEKILPMLTNFLTQISAGEFRRGKRLEKYDEPINTGKELIR